MIWNRTFFSGLLGIIAAIVIGYGIFSAADTPKTVEGQVVSVEQQSITTISSLTLKDASGKQWVFQGAGSFVGFTPSHLREHGALRELVTVEFEETDSGVLTILGISD
ncbi:MAG: hypothetical protein V3T49_03440 [Dehalococcoidia bacterium]